MYIIYKNKSPAGYTKPYIKQAIYLPQISKQAI